MKKIFTRYILAAFLIVLAVTTVYAAEVIFVTVPATSSAIAYTGRSFFYGLTLKTDGTNNITLNIYSGLSDAGEKLLPTDLVVQGTDYYFGYSPPLPIYCATGIYVKVAVAGGGTCAYQVLYSK